MCAQTEQNHANPLHGILSFLQAAQGLTQGAWPRRTLPILSWILWDAAEYRAYAPSVTRKKAAAVDPKDTSADTGLALKVMYNTYAQ